MKRFYWILVWGLSLIMFHNLQGIAFGKKSASIINGHVKDEKGKPLSYANVYLEDRFEGCTSDENGFYSFEIQAVGKFTLVCSFIGYETFRKSITLKPQQTVGVDIRLKTASVKGETITVIASAFTSSDKEGVTLSCLDVVTTPGAAADVFWAMKTFPGVQQVDEGAGLFVRGGDVSETAIYLDGALLNHPYKHESPTGGFFGTISPFLLKGTFFSSGGFSSRFGNALSGVLDMESQDIPAKRAITLGVGLAAHSMKLEFPMLNDRLGISISGNKSQTETMFRLNGNTRNFSHYPSAYDFNLNTMFRYSKNGYLKLFIFREEDKVGVQIDDPVYDVFFMGNSTSQLYNLKFNQLIGKKLLLSGNVARSTFARDMIMSVMELDIEDQLRQANLNGEYYFNHYMTIRSGINYFYTKALFTGKMPEDDQNLAENAPTDLVYTDYRSHRTAGYLESEIATPWAMLLTSGIRVERESISKETSIDPRINLTFPLTTQTSITAAYGIYHQFPEIRYYDSYIGNPGLTSMRATHSVLGVNYQKEAAIYRIEAYYKDYKNLLLEDEPQNYLNDGYGFAYGLDLFAKKSFRKFSGWLSYSYLAARRKWFEYTKLTSPAFDITHNFTWVLKYAFSSKAHFGAAYRYATGKPYTPAEGEYNTARVPAYQKLDLTFSYLHSFFDSNFTVFYLSVANIFDRHNIFDYRYSTDYTKRQAVTSSFDRSVYFGVSFSL